jgi:hypothetical protein
MELLEEWVKKRPRLWRAYVYVNFCKSEYADGTLKDATLLFRLFSRVFYLECSCCSAIRGLLIGALLVEAIRWLL